MFGLFALLAACATSNSDVTRAQGIHDPFEAGNRKVHGFNKGLDKEIIRPVAYGYAAVVPFEIRSVIGNFAENLSMPSVVVNSLLQGDLRGAGLSTVRFLFNSTIGIGGLVDAATEFKIDEHQTDFGETLAVWGVKEGAYLELPLIGPSTQRAAAGKVVDLFTNPLSYQLNSPEKYYGLRASAMTRLSDRARFGDTIDSVLYESADSYAQSRLIYLQNRRFELGTASEGADPYSDPYEDPYAQ
ncbi:MAG: VacJ family lipoprotein [Sulfitobacter sp.]